jgi:hypothetical protein
MRNWHPNQPHKFSYQLRRPRSVPNLVVIDTFGTGFGLVRSTHQFGQQLDKSVWKSVDQLGHRCDWLGNLFHRLPTDFARRNFPKWIVSPLIYKYLFFLLNGDRSTIPIIFIEALSPTIVETQKLEDLPFYQINFKSLW